MSFEKRKDDAFLTIKRKKKIKQLMTHEELVSEMLKNPKVLAEYELNKSYELDDGQLDKKQYAKIKKLVRFELDKSTGEVVRLFDD